MSWFPCLGLSSWSDIPWKECFLEIKGEEWSLRSNCPSLCPVDGSKAQLAESDLGFGFVATLSLWGPVPSMKLDSSNSLVLGVLV